ncbi:superoxide dismutase [Vibrio parahaemolyticus]|uniref:superoxide dismutase n=1 Tax=Vibrio parahaemolyticus TaxID=670 RepID=UPI0011207520|nr:superoxide dismutase [Vibrio parahaemolyticus]EJG0040340.1 superoxide dismutase [Vibrio parahaemolyticus]TOA00389.1 superoxide dismutase [Vibrio parahaemolyticus]
MSHTFPALPYPYDALEPYIDAKTMEVHYSKHHKTYFDKFVTAVQGSDLETQSLDEIFAAVSQHSPAIRNNGGGEPQGALAQAINDKFGHFEKFKDEFAQAAVNTFGSGFAWLVVKDGDIHITSTSNQDNPLMDVADVRGEPILALDVWEHAYYICYQNRRPEYINAWWNVVNWRAVEENYARALV